MGVSRTSSIGTLMTLHELTETTNAGNNALEYGINFTL